MFRWHRWGVTWDPDLLRPAYKWALYAAFAGCWIAAVYFNGKVGRIQSNIALLFAIGGVGTLAAYGWLLLKSERFRQLALRPNADFAPTTKSLQWITWGASAIAGIATLKLLTNVA
jgi:hypothetical protein